jgi:hypothetical protein
MAETADNRARIDAATGRARRRWLVSAMVNAGGRWAVLPAGVCALAGIVLALAGETSPAVLLPLVAAGLVSAAAALATTWRVYAKPGTSGAPDWSLLLDRALGLNDALPAYLEGKGRFNAALEGRIAAALDIAKEKAAAPRRQYAPLAVALILALFPLVSWLPDPLRSEPELPQVGKAPQAADEPEPPVQPGTAKTSGKGEEGEQPAESTGENSGGGNEGEVQKRPDGRKTEGGAGDPPEDIKPQPMKDNPKPNAGGTGDNPMPPTDAPKPEDKPLETDLTKIKPVAGDGETRTEDRTRWVYNPDGRKLDGATPLPSENPHGAERALPRTKITSSERKRIENIYRKLYE